MINTQFEAYKVKREIRRSGKQYLFTRQSKNAFDEYDNSMPPIEVGTICAIYHEQNSRIDITGLEGTRVRTEKIPMLLCLWEGTQSEQGNILQIDDITIINNKVFKVTGIVNIQEWNIISDISLEVVDNGNNVEL